LVSWKFDRHSRVTGATTTRCNGCSRSAAEFAEEVGLVHAVLKGFAAVDEDYGDLVGELPTELFVGVHIDVLPSEAAAAMEFGEGLFDDLAEMAAFAGVDHDLAEFGHRGEFSKYARVSSSRVGETAELGSAGLPRAAVPT
jgi:hypothetical protein